MDAQRRRIPPNEWETWKETILDLTRQEPNQKVMAIMRDKHGFDASLSQYEAQLRHWGYRKNLSPEEWTNVFEIVDKLKSQHKEFRILISGNPVGDDKIERMRRRCKKQRNTYRTMQERSARLRHASIEVREPSGNWTPYANPETVVGYAQSQIRELFASPVTSAVGNGTIDTGLNDEQDQQGQVYDNAGALDIGMSIGVRVPRYMGIPPPSASDLSCFASLQYNHAVQEESWLVAPEFSDLIPPTTTSQQFPRGESWMLAGNESELSSFYVPHWARSPSPQLSRLSPAFGMLYDVDAVPLQRLMKDLGLLGNNPMDLTSDSAHFSVIPSPIMVFQADIIASMSVNDATQSHKVSSDVTRLLSSLKGLLPNLNLQVGYDSGYNHMMEDQILHTTLVTTLISSTVDGFAALGDIPIQSVLKYLKRCMDIKLLSKVCHSHVGKALAENLFRAAIEAKDRSALKCMLDFPCIDINSIVCIVDGQKYTPIGRAVSLQDLGMVKMFLDGRAEVNKTCDLDASPGGILGLLLNTTRRNDRISSEFIEIVKLLLRAGAKLHLDIVRRALHDYNIPDLAFDLVSSVQETDHSNLIRDDFLSHIAVYLDDGQATQATKNIIMACERTQCHKCRTDYQEELDWALIQGAKRGHLQLVRLLLLHSKTPHKALSGAIRSGMSEVVEAILTLKPDINAPAHSIDNQSWVLGLPEYSRYATTSYAEAIEAGNERLLLEMEDKGALELLNQGGRFEPAITAASKIGNMVHVRKLLKSYPSPTPSHMSRALLYAVEEGYEGVFQALLAAGADVNRPSSYDPVTPNALFAALLRRNLGMVRAILSADVMEGLFQEIRYKGRDSSIFREALRWGNDMIVHDLLSALPSGTLGYGDLSLVLDAGRTALFRSLLKRGAVSVFALTGCLEIGLSRGDTKLIQELVEMGADPLDLQIFTKCLDEYPNMLLSLCKHVSFRKSHHVVPRFGTDALYLAVARGQAGLAAVTFLLGTGLIDAKSFPTHTAIQLLPHSTPLGQAIYVSRNGQHSNFEVIRELLDYGCDPNSTVTRPAYPTDSRKTALLEAINTRSADLVKLLIDRGARVNEEAKLGLKRTPLQKAVEVESLEIVTLLLEQKAEVNARPADRGGATAFQLAAIRGNCIIAAKLLEKGADLFAPPAQINGRWPLEGAAENGRFQMINFLWLQNRGCFDPEVCRRAMELAKGNGFMACRDAIEDFLRERERVADFLAFT